MDAGGQGQEHHPRASGRLGIERHDLEGGLPRQLAVFGVWVAEDQEEEALIRKAENTQSDKHRMLRTNVHQAALN